MEEIRSFLRKHQNVVSYLFFGFLTTLVNFLVYFPLFNWLHCSAAICNICAWTVAVAFAYLTNKPFVFRSNDWSFKTVYLELMKFVSCRIGSGLLETLLIWFFVDLRSSNGNLVKILVSILVVVLNYISSKWIVFSRREKD